jgi:hypothetical protein
VHKGFCTVAELLCTVDSMRTLAVGIRHFGDIGNQPQRIAQVADEVWNAASRSSIVTRTHRTS